MVESFRILPREDGILFEDDEIEVRVFTDGFFSTDLDATFFAVLSGRPVINFGTAKAGMYGLLTRGMMLTSAKARVMLASHKTHTGIFQYSGPIEDKGRLRYIDGCTDTGLVQPLKLGDPCLNALFFPAGTKQTAHTHPSHRIGAIYDGEGWCMTPSGPTPMRQGDVFIIPKDSVHWFETMDSAMRIMVFHPDSEFGPTDEHHQMLDATDLVAA